MSKLLKVAEISFIDMKFWVEQSAIWRHCCEQGAHKMAAVVHAGLPSEEPVSLPGGGPPSLER